MRVLLLAIALFALSVPVHAHTSGTSFESVIDGYLVDIGYSIKEPTTDDVVSFDFQLQKDDTTATFSDVWVKIEDERRTVVFAGGIHNAQYGGARMSYRFPEAGSYMITVRYEAGDVRLADVAVPMTVTERTPDPSPDARLILGVVGVLALSMAGTFFWRRHTRVSP